MFDIRTYPLSDSVTMPEDYYRERLSNSVAVQLDLDKYDYLLEAKYITSGDIKPQHNTFAKSKLVLWVPVDAPIARVPKSDEFVLYSLTLPSALNYQVLTRPDYLNRKCPFPMVLWLNQPPESFATWAKDKDLIVTGTTDSLLNSHLVEEARSKQIAEIFKLESNIAKILLTPTLSKNINKFTERVSIDVGYPTIAQARFGYEYIYVSGSDIVLTEDSETVKDRIHAIQGGNGWKINIPSLDVFLHQLNPDIVVENVTIEAVAEIVNEYFKHHQVINGCDLNDLLSAVNSNDAKYWTLNNQLLFSSGMWCVEAILSLEEIQSKLRPKQLLMVKNYLGSDC